MDMVNEITTLTRVCTMRPGRPAYDDDTLVQEVLGKLARGIPLSIALAKLDKRTKDRVRPKVKRKS
jgi:hypothetical protein